MKGYLKNQIIENLNKFLIDNNTDIDHLYDIVIYHENLPVDKIKTGLRKKIENLKVELEYQKTLKELQALDYDRATVQRETVADFLCDLFVRMRLKIKDQNLFEDHTLTYTEIIVLRDEYLAMFAIPVTQFNEILEQAYTRALPAGQMQPASMTVSDPVLQQINEDIVKDINIVADQESVTSFEADEILEKVHEEDPGSILEDMKVFAPPTSEGNVTGSENPVVDHLKDMSIHLKEHRQEEAAEANEEQREITKREAEEDSVF